MSPVQNVLPTVCVGAGRAVVGLGQNSPHRIQVPVLVVVHEGAGAEGGGEDAGAGATTWVRRAALGYRDSAGASCRLCEMTIPFVPLLTVCRTTRVNPAALRRASAVAVESPMT